MNFCLPVVPQGRAEGRIVARMGTIEIKNQCPDFPQKKSEFYPKDTGA